MTTKHGPTQMSMFSSEEPLARVFLSQDSEPEWLTLEETLHLSILQSLHATAPTGWYGRTSPVFCLATRGGTLVPLSGQWSNSGMASPGECLTLSTSAFHNDAVVCSLSDVLETGEVQPKYYLSPRACAGILRRAENRGKQLPTMLRLALEQVALGLSEQAIVEDKTA